MNEKIKKIAIATGFLGLLLIVVFWQFAKGLPTATSIEAKIQIEPSDSCLQCHVALVTAEVSTTAG